jgi:hypothetical protein
MHAGRKKKWEAFHLALIDALDLYQLGNLTG